MCLRMKEQKNKSKVIPGSNSGSATQESNAISTAQQTLATTWNLVDLNIEQFPKIIEYK